MNGPRILKIEEFQSLLKLMDTVFPAVGPFCETDTACFTGREQELKQHIVYEDDGEIVSHMGLFTREIFVGKALIKVGGVGSVATYEKYRGQGFMNKMFEKAFEIMNKEGYDLSCLGGDRKRYNTFGYEEAGRRLAFLVSDRYVKGMKFDGFSFRKYSGDAADLKALLDIHSKEYFKSKHDMYFYEKLFAQKAKETFFAIKDGKIVSYLMLVRDTHDKNVLGWVYEYGGDAEGFKYILQQVFATQGIGSMNIVAPIVEHALSDTLFSVSNNWYTENNRIIKIVNLKSLLTKFIPHMELARERAGAVNSGKVTLYMGKKQEATLEIGKSVRVLDNACANVLELSDLQMVRLLLGLTKPSEAFKLKKEQLILDSVFPLDCFMWLTDSV